MDCVAFQVPLSMEFSRQEYWSELPCPLPGDLPDPGIEPTCLMPPALAGVFFFFFFTTGATWEALLLMYIMSKLGSYVFTAVENSPTIIYQWQNPNIEMGSRLPGFES